jgi:serine/threonine protein kinase
MAAADRLIEVFNQAQDRPAGPARDGFLALACRDDAELETQVLSLLRAHEGAGEFLGTGPALAPEIEAELARLKPEEAGEMIGPYKLMEQIGQGGFGTVWVADQERPVRRRVALKIIKLGMDTKEVIARFEQERQALAMMDHPHIAKVFDAGATQWGRPFFAMELVRGIKITDYCDQTNLPTRERLALFIQVCNAVQHAHQKGIIHRDLKPSNILVTLHDGVPVPKVIDFGVAKATQHQRLTDLTIYTQFEQMIGTPLYMSPEQAEMSGLDVDTRSDIYSLGALLYELLTGRTPFDPEELMRKSYDEIRRTIREEEPQTPSMFLKTMADTTRVTVAQHRQADPDKLTKIIRGDLDWIVMKALEKDRNRRYDTANGIAQDLRHHLNNESITARPPTTAYLLGKLVKRHKTAVVAGTAIAASLVVGIAASVWQAVRANAALDELRATAPALAGQAASLASQGRLQEAVEKLEYAARLRPDLPDYLLAKADLLQAQLKLTEASQAYHQVLRRQPEHPLALANARLCEALLKSALDEFGALSREGLAQLRQAMQQQNRPIAEIIAVARHLGEEHEILIGYWRKRLDELQNANLVLTQEIDPLVPRVQIAAADAPASRIERPSVPITARIPLEDPPEAPAPESPVPEPPAPIASTSIAMPTDKEQTAIPKRTAGLKKAPRHAQAQTQRPQVAVAIQNPAPTPKPSEPTGGVFSGGVSGENSSGPTPARTSQNPPVSAVVQAQATSTPAPMHGNSAIELIKSRLSVGDDGLLNIDLSGSAIADLTALAGMPVGSLRLSNCPHVRDLSSLRGLPLHTLLLDGTGVTDLLPVAGCPKLRTLAIPLGAENIAVLRSMPELRQLSYTSIDEGDRTRPAEDFWRAWDAQPKRPR